jgi:predicted flap endonuclease-1-like 5' DNA nuclease
MLRRNIRHTGVSLMARTTETIDFEATRTYAQRALALPIGLASPMWAVFGAAAGAGVAYWWMTRWTEVFNVEALAGAARVAERAQETVEEAVSRAASTVAQSGRELAEAVSVSEPVADDLTRLVGIGPKLAANLAERGVTSFAELAAWSEEEARAFDDELSLKGRVVRDEWVAQARRTLDEA